MSQQSKYDALARGVFIDPEGRMMRLSINLQDLGVRDDLLLAASGEAAGVPIYHMCDVPNTEPPMRVHFYAASNPGMAVRLPSLRFNTFWELSEDNGNPILVPVFNDRGINMSLDWVPPADCALYFVVRNSTPHLIAVHQHPEKKHWQAVRLDLPNIYPDGKVCMGRNWSPPETGSFVGRMRTYLDSIHQSVWNMDLMDGTRERTSKQLIRFSAGDAKCLPPSRNWWECGSVISGSSFNWVVAMAQARKGAP